MLLLLFFPLSSFFLFSLFFLFSPFFLFLSFHRSAVYEQAGRAVIPHSATFAGGHSPALDVEIKQFAGPGPCHLLRNGFGSKTGTFQQSSVFNSGRGQVPLTMARHKSLQPREYENIGPGKKDVEKEGRLPSTAVLAVIAVAAAVDCC